MPIKISLFFVTFFLFAYFFVISHHISITFTEMNRAIIFTAILASVIPFAVNAKAPTRAQRIAAELRNPASKTVLVASHRGDWRNWPENSLEAMQSAIDQGADIIELDLKMTKDSVLVVCHDAKVDRTTNGKGFVKDLTADSIASLFLKSGHGIRTDLRMPTLRQALELCKDQAVVNIDQGYKYYDAALAICEELGVTDQVLIKGNALPDKVAKKFASHKNNMLYMPIISLQKGTGQDLYKAYKKSGEVPMAFEVCWDTNPEEAKNIMADILASGAKLWVNSLWPSLNGGLCDDAAARADKPGDIYGQLVDTGATIIQTDRIPLIVNYLRSRGLHD